MKTISNTHRASLLRDLQKLREEIKELEKNPPPKLDLVEVFCRTLREGLDQDEQQGRGVAGGDGDARRGQEQGNNVQPC